MDPARRPPRPGATRRAWRSIAGDRAVPVRRQGVAPVRAAPASKRPAAYTRLNSGLRTALASAAERNFSV